MANVVVSGDTSGSVTLAAPAVAGATTITLPNTTGTMAYVNATNFLPAYNGSQLTSVNASQLQGFTVGTGANNIVQLNASSQLPAVSGALLTNLPSGAGALIRAPQILTSGTSYTTPAGCTDIYVECVGGGGGGGGADIADAGGDSATGGGGGSGAYCAKYFSVTGNTSYTYAIGAGGSGGANTGTNGTAGGNTTFTVGATTVTAGGGGFGLGFSSTVKGSLSPGGLGGTATNGDMNVSGNVGATGYSGDIDEMIGGAGAPSLFGGSGRGQVYFIAGTSKVGANAASTSGTTGGGGGGAAAGSAAGSAGSSGGNGIIRIWEFT